MRRQKGVRHLEQLGDFLFSDGGYSPHGFCIAWDPAVLYTHIGADLLIALSYFAIPAIMLVFLRKRPVPELHLPALLFVAFIAACGLSHLLSIVTMYLPWYGLQGLMKLATGLISFVTVLALWKLLPEALRIPSPAALMAALDARDGELAERKAAEERLQVQHRALDRKIAEVEAANNELREFAYAASHDLKSPANTLCLWLQDFEEEHGAALGQTGRADLKDAARIVGRMRTLVEDVLSYSRVVNSDANDRAPMDVRAIFQNAAADLEMEIRRARAQVDIAPMPPFTGYAPLISILAHNLLSNALKFRSPDRSPHVTVTGEIVPGPENAFVLRVRDNGIGIPPEHGDRVFRLFQRLHRAEDYAGTGLGLALCRRIAVTHGGQISLVSQEDAGAEFIITFPSEQTHVPQAA
jgi:signal transduction histidine kinase